MATFGTFFEKIGLLFIPTSGHTAATKAFLVSLRVPITA